MIELNYKEVLTQASELENISEEIKALVDGTLTRGLDELQNAWSGDSANLFARKCNELYDDINKTAKSLGRFAGVVRKTAETFRDVEEAAKKTISVIGL